MCEAPGTLTNFPAAKKIPQLRISKGRNEKRNLVRQREKEKGRKKEVRGRKKVHVVKTMPSAILHGDVRSERRKKNQERDVESRSYVLGTILRGNDVMALVKKALRAQ